MCLAATKGCLKLYDWFAALTGQPLGDLRQQKPHALRDESTVEESDRVLILRSSLACVYGGDVGGELRLLKGPFQNVAIGNNDLPPRPHGLCPSSIEPTPLLPLP